MHAQGRLLPLAPACYLALPPPLMMGAGKFEEDLEACFCVHDAPAMDCSSLMLELLMGKVREARGRGNGPRHPAACGRARSYSRLPPCCWS